MATPGTWNDVVKRYDAAPKDVRDYFDALPSLIENYTLDIPLAYQFSCVELAHTMALYCGVVKLHKVDATLARKAVESQHITRQHFSELFETIYGKKVEGSIAKKLNKASAIRDKVLHGKAVTPKELRNAIVDVVDYATEFNDFVQVISGLRPFGKIKGFKGRAKPLEKSTSRWVLRGVSFNGF